MYTLLQLHFGIVVLAIQQNVAGIVKRNFLLASVYSLPYASWQSSLDLFLVRDQLQRLQVIFYFDRWNYRWRSFKSVEYILCSEAHAIDANFIC